MRKKFLVILLTAIIFLSGATLGVSTVYRVNEVTVYADTVSMQAKTEAEQLREELLKVYEKQSSFFVDESTALEIVEKFLETENICGICISTAGMVDTKRGEIFYAAL